MWSKEHDKHRGRLLTASEQRARIVRLLKRLAISAGVALGRFALGRAQDRIEGRHRDPEHRRRNR